MRLPTPIPRMHADENGLKHSELSKAQFKRYVFENEKKNQRKSA